MGPSPGGEEYLFIQTSPEPPFGKSLFAASASCAFIWGLGVCFFSVPCFVLYPFPGSAAEIDSFGSAVPPGLLASLPSFLSLKGSDWERSFPVTLILFGVPLKSCIRFLSHSFTEVSSRPSKGSLDPS